MEVPPECGRDDVFLTSMATDCERRSFPSAFAYAPAIVNLPADRGFKTYPIEMYCFTTPLLLIIPVCWLGPLTTIKPRKEGGTILCTLSTFSTTYSTFTYSSLPIVFSEQTVVNLGWATNEPVINNNPIAKTHLDIPKISPLVKTKKVKGHRAEDE